VQILGDTQQRHSLFEARLLDHGATRSYRDRTDPHSPKPTQYIGKTGGRAAKSVGYVNAGTVEFLLDRQPFYS